MVGWREPPAGKTLRGKDPSPSPQPRVQPDPAPTADHPQTRRPSLRTALPLLVRALGPAAARRRREGRMRAAGVRLARGTLLPPWSEETAKNRQNGRLLMSDPKEKVTIESNEAMSEKEVPSKNIENKVSLKNIENRVSSRSIESKDILTNLQSDLLSSSCLKESTGEVSKDAVTVKQEKNNEYCLQDIDDKLSESAEDDDDDDTNDEDNDEDSNPKKNTQAPLELMAEFLRAEMAREYQLAKKLCQMILIYEPENPEAKEFFTLIEEMLLMEKTQNREQDGEDSDEDSSGESKGESDEELSDESSDEGEDGS
ncbi:glutamate-rich protein 2 isoform X4 [Macaca fascicularis]|uniref:glutamate-rich protein 2 isoform X4 n=1 Tax=Macaca fascicularis TaxID=9541 RepID=UPI0032B0305D